MSIQEYIDWAKRETATLSSSPEQTVEDWRKKWMRDLKPLVDNDAIFELASLVVARWEFLGCLVTGYSHSRSNQDQAAAYARRFLEPVNPRYAATHPTIIPNLSVARLLFEMLRNKSLHGFTPAAVFDLSRADVIVWACQSRGSSAAHLGFSTPVN